jgi:hypothetical protein
MSVQDEGDQIVAATAGDEVVPAPAEQAPVAEGAPPEPVAPDANAELVSRLDRFEQTFATRLDAIEQARVDSGAPQATEAEQQAQAEQAQQEALEALLAELDPEQGHLAEDGGITIQGLMTLMDRRLEERDKQRAATDAERADADRREKGWSQLEQQWPRLKDDDAFQEAVGDRVIQEAQKFASIALPGDPEAWRRIANEPGFTQRVLDEHFASERPAPQDPPVQLERQSAAAGAAQAGAQAGDEGDDIVAAMTQHHFRLRAAS